MEIRLILLAVLAHIFGDFILQGDIITKMRFPDKLVKESNELLSVKLSASKKNTMSATKALEKKVSVHSSGNKALRGIFIKDFFYIHLKITYIIRNTFKGNIIHSLIQGLAFVMFIFLNNYLGNVLLPNKFFAKVNIDMVCVNSIFIIFYYTIAHLIVDQLKVIIALRRPKLSRNIYLFISDQIIHLISFLFIPGIYLDNMFTGLKVINKFLSNPMFYVLSERLLVILIVFFTATAFAAIFIKVVMDYIDEKQLNKNDESVQVPSTEIKRGGYIIGILERILIISSILISHPQLIGYILTAKSIARLKKLNEDKFAEYFLIGNSLSFIFAIAGGTIINFMINN